MASLGRRIVLSAGSTALILGLIGWGLSQLASIWLAAPAVARGDEVVIVEDPEPFGDVSEQLRWRVPLLMAVWGFVLVTLGEVVLSAWRRRRPPATPTPPDRQPDDAERLLAELLRQAEAGEARQAGATTAEPAADSATASFAPPTLPTQRSAPPTLPTQRAEGETGAGSPT